MGRIKSLMIKKAAKQLLEGEGHKFNKDFTNNKKLLRNSMPSKSTRNKVAGYISRIMVMREKAPRKQKEIVMED